MGALRKYPPFNSPPQSGGEKDCNSKPQSGGEKDCNSKPQSGGEKVHNSNRPNCAASSSFSHRERDCRSLTIGLILIALGILVLVSLAGRIEKTIGEDPFAQSLLYIPHERLLHWAALGDDGAAADLLWLRAIFYIAANDMDEAQEKWMEENAEQNRARLENYHASADTVNRDALDARQNPILAIMFFWNENSPYAPHLFSVLDKVTNLDSLFVTPYYNGALFLSMAYGRYDEARRLLDKGIMNCPTRWEPIYYRGFLRLFYENDKTGAMEDISLAAAKSNAPSFVLDLAARLRAGLTGRDAALAFLYSLYEAAEDRDLKKRLEEVIKTMTIKQYNTIVE